jgi:hypothetical protein
MAIFCPPAAIANVLLLLGVFVTLPLMEAMPMPMDSVLPPTGATMNDGNTKTSDKLPGDEEREKRAAPASPSSPLPTVADGNSRAISDGCVRDDADHRGEMAGCGGDDDDGGGNWANANGGGAMKAATPLPPRRAKRGINPPRGDDSSNDSDNSDDEVEV